MKILIIFYLLCYSAFAIDGLEYNKEELKYLDNIGRYEVNEGYLDDNELKVIEEIKRNPLKMGYVTKFEIDVDLFSKIIKKYLDIDIILVKDTWENLLNAIEAGDIDLLLNLSHSKKRERIIYYSNPYYIDSLYVVYPKKANLDTWMDYEGKIINYTKGSFYADELLDLAKIYNVKYQLKESLNINDVTMDEFNAYDRMELYEVIISPEKNLKYTELFTINPVYLGISKQLEDEKIRVIKKIFDNFVGRELSSSLRMIEGNLINKMSIKSLTTEEINYLDEKKIRVALDSYNYPISYKDPETKEFQGSMKEILRERLEVVANKVEYEYIETHLDVRELILGNKDCIGLLPMTIENVKVFSFSEYLYRIPYYLVDNKYRDSDKESVGISKKSHYLEGAYKASLGFSFTVYDDNEKLMKAFEEGEVDCIVLSEGELKYYQNEELKTYLDIKKILGDIKLGVASNRSNEILSSISLKLFKRDDTIEVIKKKWMYVPNMIGIKYKQKNLLLTFLHYLLIVILLYVGYLAFKLKKVNSILKKISGIDYLTGIYNRRKFYEKFDPRWKKAKESKGLAHLIIIDLDNFKGINDNFGHAEGDKVLKRISVILMEEFKGGCIGRYGGDEFIAGMTGVSTEKVLTMSESVRKNIENLKIDTGNSKILTTSVGIVATVPEKVEMRDYIKIADSLLYESKKNGKNKIYHKNL